MAFYDWNRDGKKDGIDDFMEYQMYKDYTKNSSHQVPNGNGISTFGAIVATVAGLFLSAGMLALVVDNADNVPVIIIIILWIICSGVLAAWFDHIGF